ncbi:efflux RND transporter permease subunit, partial [Singulisphaera rosea]
TEALAVRLKRELPPLLPASRVVVQQIETGPPIGIPVQVRLQGAELATIRKLGEQIKGFMREFPGSMDIQDDWDPESVQIALNVDPDRANLAGITHQDVAVMMNGGLAGYVPTQIRERDRLIPVALKLRPDERSRLDDMKTLNTFSMRTGDRVPLDQISSFRAEMISPKIFRRDNERCLTIKSDTVPGVLPSRLVEFLDQKLRVASKDWPPGYRYTFGGEKEEQEKGFNSMAVALIASTLAIYLALVLQFNSLTKPFVVFAAVPFGMVGGLIGLLIFDVPLGFFAMLGLTSLIGVIISHIIVLFEYIEEAHERGEPLRQAVIDAALVRLRPVLVTVLATVGGLIPLVVKGGPLWEPLCYVQIIGLLVATLVTTVVVPVLYVIFVEDLGMIRWDAPGEHSEEGPPREFVHDGHRIHIEPPRPTAMPLGTH